MKKSFFLIILFLLLSNCVGTPGTAFLGPVFSGAKTGSAYHASLSYGSSKMISHLKDEYLEKKEKILEKTDIFFNTNNKKAENPQILESVIFDKIKVSEVVEEEPLP
tara:strand:- start:142 stop:462 length:321 start_codon:yes stop_codon:yes gene_type:complete